MSARTKRVYAVTVLVDVSVTHEKLSSSEIETLVHDILKSRVPHRDTFGAGVGYKPKTDMSISYSVKTRARAHKIERFK